ncbi:MAG: hypothetical protein HYX22_01860 [Candidatus Yanofskybacteria bacterium]|nr:hypothetical protein [Candidatus Yanofskybacteria bacterium]
MNKRSRNSIIIIFITATALTLVTVFLYSNNGSSHRMLGKIIEMDNGELTVEGRVMSDSGIPEEKRTGTVKLKIDSESKLTKFLIVTDSNHPVNEPYSPRSEMKAGDLNDLVPGVSAEIITRNNIWRKNMGIVDQMSYYVVNPN